MNPKHASDQWLSFSRAVFDDRTLGFTLDLSAIPSALGQLPGQDRALTRAIRAMHELEHGVIVNKSEGRMVGHYWLRAPGRAPAPEITGAIERALARIREFAGGVRSGSIVSGSGKKFSSVLMIGIGGSALGPKFMIDALRAESEPIRFYLLDNTDPQGIERVLASIPDLGSALVLIASKSGSTKETRNGMLEVAARFSSEGVSFAKSAVAITCEGSQLDALAIDEKWLARFPLWDWVGGRTSITSAVGLLPAALVGISIDGFLAGAAAMDELTRAPEPAKNPAALLSLAWFAAGSGRGEKNMVVLPYRDRLELLSRYLQQLVMESLGKEKTRNGEHAEQGITVYGNKGSTDQHAFIQQLRDGRHDFFVTFVEVLKDDTASKALQVEPETTTSDYLFGFLHGTRGALSEKGRESLTITFEELSPRTLGALIALFERAVGIYAEIIDVNAYDQPGVEAGKRAATEVLKTQHRIIDFLSKQNAPLGCQEIADHLKIEDPGLIFHLLRRLAALGKVSFERGDAPVQDRYVIRNSGTRAERG